MPELAVGGAGTHYIPDRVTLVAHAVADSTNTLARAMAADGAAAWTVVQALEQRAGRGRHGRDWVSPPGNLYTSTILRPAARLDSWPEVSFVVALAVAAVAARAAPGVDIRLKWPNDVLADGAKLAGILLETLPANGDDGALIVGVGINVAHSPQEARYGATCLDLLAGRQLALEWVLAAYLRALVDWHEVWARDGFARIREEWLARAYGLGQEVEVVGRSGEPLRGCFSRLAEDGRMIVERWDGEIEMVSAGTLNFIDRADR